MLKKKLNRKHKIYCFDMDGVICSTPGNHYRSSKPIKKAIKKINEIYSRGYRIIIFTARFMGRSNENAFLAKKKGYTFTYSQLKKWKVKFHKLIFGKPSFDFIIDDKSIFFRANWHKLI
jgi:histidinol phosphatase-like enzyme